MPFLPGKPKTGGRQAGTPNRLTGLFREAVLVVYEGLGGHDAFLQWAKENRTEYYRIASRLIPAEMRDDGRDRQVTVIVQRRGGQVLRTKPTVDGYLCEENGG